MSKLSPRDKGRIKRSQAGAHERAEASLRVIDRARKKGRELTTEALAAGKDVSDIKDSWPLHAFENRSAGTSLRTPIEGEARMAFARKRAGVPLSARDEYVLSKYPDGGPWQKSWEAACAEYRRPVE